MPRVMAMSHDVPTRPRESHRGGHGRPGHGAQRAANPVGEPVGVSNAVLFLASDEGRYITGVALPVDAGCVTK
jgi:NAD(P)-dependent dehydrogenase (short-subunit alcohol dehydrogenase family)